MAIMPTSTRTPTSTAAAILRSARPRQWAKNLLVIAAPLSGGVIDEPHVIPRVLAAFVSFTLAASAVYLFNDVRDAEADRRHPTKRTRPVASGALSSGLATSAAAALAASSMGIALAVGVELALTMAVYLAVQVLYAMWLKHQPVLDLAIVSAGFLLRAIAGGVATGVELSQWFLLVASFGSLFMVAGKRYSELMSLGEGSGTRRSLETYSESYLRFVWSLAASVTVMAYSLWAFEIRGDSTISWQPISIAPFVLGLMRYAVDIDRGLAGEPEDAVLRDRVLQVLSLVWLATFALGVYST